MSAAKYLMQAKSSASGELATWRADLPDWAAVHAPVLHDGTWQDVTLAGGGFETPDTTPDGAFVFDDGSLVAFDDGSIAVSA